MMRLGQAWKEHLIAEVCDILGGVCTLNAGVTWCWLSGSDLQMTWMATGWLLVQTLENLDSTNYIFEDYGLLTHIDCLRTMYILTTEKIDTPSKVFQKRREGLSLTWELKMGSTLPPELWLKIFSLLSPRDLAAVASVCRWFFSTHLSVKNLITFSKREWRGVALMPHLWSKVRVSKRRLIKDGFHQVSNINSPVALTFGLFFNGHNVRLVRLDWKMANKGQHEIALTFSQLHDDNTNINPDQLLPITSSSHCPGSCTWGSWTTPGPGWPSSSGGRSWHRWHLIEHSANTPWHLKGCYSSK